MNKKNEIVLDVIPIYKGEIYPTKDMIYHYKNENLRCVNKETEIDLMIEEIRRHFSDCNAVIILEKGNVIEVL